MTRCVQRAVGVLLEPAHAVVVTHARQDVAAAVAVDVDRVHEPELRGGAGAARRRLAPRPRSGMGADTSRRRATSSGRPHVGRRFEPSARREDVVAAVAVDVAGADAVPVAAIAHDVLGPACRPAGCTRRAGPSARSNCGSSSRALPSLSRSTSSANSVGKPLSISVAVPRPARLCQGSSATRCCSRSSRTGRCRPSRRRRRRSPSRRSCRRTVRSS